MDATLLYFAFGPHLDRARMNERCPGARFVGPAWLPAHRPAFAGVAAKWDGGGMATIEPAPAESTPGALWAVGLRHIEALDGYKHCPEWCGRVNVAVRDAKGATHEAVAYRLKPRPERPPTPRYYDGIARAYGELGHDPAPLHRALAHALEQSGHELVFAYGTLLPGERRHGLLRDARRVCDTATEPAYSLVDLGTHPALVDHGDTAVRGVLYAVPAASLGALDDSEPHTHRLERRRIRLPGDMSAWTYVMPNAQAEPGARVLEHGDWRRRYEGRL